MKTTKKAVKLLLTFVLIIGQFLMPHNDAKAAEQNWTFNYTGYVQEFTAPYTGRYSFEIYGGSGGNASAYYGGTAGKTSGIYNLRQGQKIYIAVGGAGSSTNGGYNGGAAPQHGGFGGGGATSITTTNRGVLQNYSNYINEIIAVAGGGGGSGSGNENIASIIGNGGGLTGGVSSTFHNVIPPYWFVAASQTTGHAFGYGGSGVNGGGSGGGGYFGGVGLRSSTAGGNGGSGYVTSDVQNAISSGSEHIGNGFAKISYLGGTPVTVTINLYNGATINGTNTYTITGYAGESKTLNISYKPGYSLSSWQTKFGDSVLSGNRLTFGFKNSSFDALYSGSLNLTSLQSNGNLTLQFTQNDSFVKQFKVFESTDKNNWYYVKNANETLTHTVKNTEFFYTGGVVGFWAPVSTTYRFYLYGAKGGDSLVQGVQVDTGGRGGFTQGERFLNAGTPVYVVVGGQGGTGTLSGIAYGGYNGGGYGLNDSGTDGPASDNEASGGGGGATHIATTNRGVLSNYANYWNEIIAVAGGGGGGSYHYQGGAGGGLSGGASGNDKIATQTEGYAFGQGQCGNGIGNSDGSGGGGGGWCGGYADGVPFKTSGGGGSGYVGGLINGGTTTSTNAGDGYAKIEWDEYVTTSNRLTNLNIKDKAAPNIPSNGSFDSNGRVVKWADNGDNGSTYYHKVESYNAANGQKLLDSNITEDTIISGVAGWYYYIDTNPTGNVTTSNSTFTKVNFTEMDRPQQTTYIHVAAIDGAGNLSGTYNFKIPGNYPVTYIDRIADSNVELGRHTTNKPYNSTVRGEDIGNNTAAGAYYTGYYYASDTSATVTEQGATVYRYFRPQNYTVTYIDRIQGTSTELGRQTASKPYGSTVAGSDLGADTTLHRYYTNYEYVSCTSATVGVNGATVYRDFKLGIAPYKVYHQQEQLDGSYITVDTNNETGIIGSSVTPPVKTYTGFTSPSTQTVTVAANGTTTVTYQYRRNSYTVTFIDISNNIELGRKTEQRKFESVVNGNEIGGSTADNAYYKNYKLTSTTSATVGTGGATVYRYFEWLTVNVQGTVSWTDNSGRWGTRPGRVKVALFQNKNSITSVPGGAGNNEVTTTPIIGLADLRNNTYSFAFNNLPVYDANGNPYTYEVRQGNENDNIVYSKPSYVSSVINPEDKYVTTQNKYNIVNALDNTAQDPNNPDIPSDSDGFHVDGAIHWVDSGNRLGYRPNTVTVSLYQDGKPFMRDGEHYTKIVDSKDDNTYSFIRLPKYRYENGEPVPYRYTAVETVSSVYLLNGKLTPAYNIHPDEEYGLYKALHFTNYFKTTPEPIIPFIPEDQKDNTITVKTNIPEPIGVTLKMLDYIAGGTPDDIDRVDGPDYNGVEYNLSVDELGEIIKHIPSGKFEIEIIDNNYELKDIIITDNTDNVHIVKENDKYYLVIDDVPDDSRGTVVINLEKKEPNYQTSMCINNYFGWPHYEGIMMTMLDVSAETDDVMAEEPKFTITYDESDTEDNAEYDYEDEVIVNEFEGDIPEDMVFVSWIDADDNIYYPDDIIVITKDIKLSPVFEYPDMESVSGGDAPFTTE